MTKGDVESPPSARSAWFQRFLDAGALLSSALDAVRGEPGPRVIRGAAARLERRGALVFADAEGFPRPPAIHGFVPAVYAVFEDREVVVNVTDPDVTDAEQASRRDLAFSAWAAAAPERDYEPIVLKGRRRD